MKNKLALLIVCLLFMAPVLAGTKSVDESRKASSDADVTIELIAGTVRIIGWDRNEVRVTGTINDRWEELEISGDEDDISIEIMPPDGSHRNVKLEADLEISVPAGVELTFETVSASVTLDGLTESVSVESISGDVEVRSDLRELEIEAISGTIEIEASVSLESVEVEVISGNVTMSGDLHPSGDYTFESVSGRITLRVPAGTGADYEIETFSGRIENDFGPKPEKAEFLPALSLSFTVGSGGADIEIETLSGTIRLLED